MSFAKNIGKSMKENRLSRSILQFIGRITVDLITRGKNSLYVFSWGGIGDTVAISSLIHYSKKAYKKEKTILVCKKNHADVASLFPYIDDVKILNRILIYCVRLCNLSCQRMYGDNYIIGNSRLLFDTWHDYSSRIDAIRSCLIQAPHDIAPSRASLKNKSNYQCNIDNNCIIIAPYANTFKSLEKDVWEQIVDSLSRRYKVYTNVFSDEEPIKGTCPICVGLIDMITIAERCRCVISYRSGFSDYLSLNDNIDHIVIYPDKLSLEYESVKIYGSQRIIDVCEQSTTNLVGDIISIVFSMEEKNELHNNSSGWKGISNGVANT